METGVSESANGDAQPEDSNNSYWKLVIPRERILFVDAPGSEEFGLLLAALEEAKIVAMDAEWKPVRRPGVSPRISILQLSCRIDSRARSWGGMERVLLARKARADAEASLAAETAKQQEEIQKQLEDVQKQRAELDRERQELREELQNEKLEVKLQRGRLQSERAAEKRKRDREAERRRREEAGEVRDGDGDGAEHSTLTKLEDGLKDLFLGRNGEVSELWEDPEGPNKGSGDPPPPVSPKKVNSDDTEQNVDNLCDILAQAEREMLKDQEGRQDTAHTEAKLESLSKDEAMAAAPDHVNPEKNFLEEKGLRSDDTEVEVNKVDRNFAANGATSENHGGETTQDAHPEPAKSRNEEPGLRDSEEIPKTDSHVDVGKAEDPKAPRGRLPRGGGTGAAVPEGDAEEEDEESGREESDNTDFDADVQLDEAFIEAFVDDTTLELPRHGGGGDDGWDGMTEEESESAEGEEVVFVLDLLALSAPDFATAMKQMLCSPRVLKLGFAFKQDQLHLAASFPGPEAIGCFDKVEPYMDIAKLYKQLHHATSAIAKHRGKRFLAGGAHSLTGISKAVLGVPLCKDSQCSNWEERPLSQKQIEYAAADTHCLLALFDALLPDALSTIGPPPALASPAAGDERSSMIEQRPSSLHETGRAGLKLFTDATRATTSTCHILSHKTGVATEMVDAALHPSPVSSPREPAASQKHENASRRYAKFVKRFSERLLVGEESRGKPRARRAREALKNPEAKELLNWVGPAPWDAKTGGDGQPKFLCDVMVEGLARQLRCVGVDAASPPTKKSDPRQLVEQATREGRLLLTKDIKLLQRRLMPDNLAYFVKTSGKWEQLEEVMKVFEIWVSESELLSRCVKCNGEFTPQPLTSGEARAAAPAEQNLPAAVLDSCEEFWQCSACHHLFWQGFQFNRAREQFAAVCTRARDEIPDPGPIQPLDIASEFLEDPEEAFAQGAF